MKKAVLILIFFFLLTLTSLVWAQEQVFDFNQANNDYLFTHNQYLQAHKDYLTTRQAYLNYQTLTSKTEAQAKALVMLETRDETIRTYLLTLRTKLAEVGILNYQQNVIYLRLDEEITWYATHKTNFASAGSLNDLVDTASETEKRYPKTEILIYQTLNAILSSKETLLQEEINQQIDSLETKISLIREKGDKETALLERWLLEAENRLGRSQSKRLEAEAMVNSLKEYDRQKNQSFNQSQFLFQEAHQYLKEANGYLLELIREVKYAD